jgi:hypothetical protein
VTLALLNAVDGFAMAMVVILTLSLGVVALLLGSIVRHGRRRDREVEELLDEVRREAEESPQPAPSAPTDSRESREPWERDGDWWKK